MQYKIFMGNDGLAVTAMSDTAAISFGAAITKHCTTVAKLFKAVFTISTFTAAVYQATNAGSVAYFEFFYMTAYGGDYTNDFMSGYTG